MEAIGAANMQAVFREANERLRDLNNSVEQVGAADFDECLACECARQDCTEYVKLSSDAWDRVRQVPEHFVVAPQRSHIFPEIDRLLETHSRYWVVQKTW